MIDEHRINSEERKMSEIEENNKKVFIYQLQGDEFVEIVKDASLKLFDLLHPTGVFLFIDIAINIGFLWFGKRSNLKDKFVAATDSLRVKNEFHPSIQKIQTEEQLMETQMFKKWIGILEHREIEEVIKKEDDFDSQFLALLRYQLKAKAKGYFYWTGQGDLKQAEIMYHHWDAYVQLCEGLGLPYKTINNEANDN